MFDFMKSHRQYKACLFILLLLISLVYSCGDNGTGVEKLELGYPRDGEAVSADLISSFVTTDWLDGSTDDIGDIKLTIHDTSETIPLNTDRIYSDGRVFFGLDLRGLPDAAYTAEIKLLDGDKVVAATDPFTLNVNNTEVRKKAIEFMWQNDISNFGRVNRWENLPIAVELSSNFPIEEYNNFQKALDFWYKYTGIKFTLYWGDDAFYGCGDENAILKNGRVYIQLGPVCGNSDASGAAGAHTDYNGTILQCVMTISPHSLSYLESTRIKIYTHEMGHCLTLNHYETPAPINTMMVGLEYCPPIIPVEMSTALKIWYNEMQPGDPLPAL